MIRVEVSVPKSLLADIESVYTHLAEPVMVAVATETQHELSNLKPPPPPRGSMKFVSEKQRRFVMAAKARGDITVPYRRGIDRNSQRMNRSYRLVRAPRNIALTNSATYWPYVIGTQQAQIHKGRWKRVDEVIIKILRSSLVPDVVNSILRRRFGGS